jgi:hypothetical protein
MKISLLDIFTEHFKDIKIDKKLAKSIYKFHISYVNNTRSHLEFFGSNLLGVHIVRFKDSDVSNFFDILDINYIKLTNDLKTVNTISTEWKITGDTLNLTIMYLIHRFLTSKDMDEKDRIRGAYDTAIVFFHRSLAAYTCDYFKYAADPNIAQAAYANLSKKHLIKKLGSWNKVIDYRANDLSGSSSIHYRTFMEFTNDTSVAYAITDSKDRIKDLIKNYYVEFKKACDAGRGIVTTSSTYDNFEGEEQLKEKVNTTENKVNYILSIVSDKNSFIKSDLIEIISNFNSNTSYKSIYNVLVWLSHNSINTHYNKLIEDFLRSTIIYSFNIIETNLKHLNSKDYPGILNGLRNYYLSSRSTDKDLLHIRDLGTQILELAINKDLNSSLIMATRTSIILYITLRTMIAFK